ncbi:MAG: hypothetical protein KQA36_03470 [Candidatus Aenigmarchaeota archaeon]|nr:hypothetical protein [Candidatus Aenigmarchaeota archaeon]
MKGLELSLIAKALIAISLIFILLIILNQMYPNFVGEGICKFYNLVLALPLPQFLKPSMQECFEAQITSRVALESLEETTLLSYVINCWRKANEGKSGKSFICFEIFVKNPKTISEKEITDLLKSRKQCNYIQNNYLDLEKSSYDCGNENKIFWNATIGGRDLTIIIKYNALAHRIEVI